MFLTNSFASDNQGANLMPYTAPTHQSKAFNCPHCGAFAHQEWNGRIWDLTSVNTGIVDTSTCARCNKSAVWVLKKMVYPDRTNVPPPNADLPEKVKETYLEAASISSKSPRAAAALLRLAIEMLCKELEPRAKDLNQAIGNLVQNGLPKQIQQALDVVRVTGNNAIHAGQINLDSPDVDSPKVVSHLFTIVNLIGESMISTPQRVSSLYDALPQGARDQIERRDAAN